MKQYKNNILVFQVSQEYHLKYSICTYSICTYIVLPQWFIMVLLTFILILLPRYPSGVALGGGGGAWNTFSPDKFEENFHRRLKIGSRPQQRSQILSS